jgi:hypothetical protein
MRTTEGGVATLGRRKKRFGRNAAKVNTNSYRLALRRQKEKMKAYVYP